MDLGIHPLYLQASACDIMGDPTNSLTVLYDIYLTAQWKNCKISKHLQYM